MLGVAANIVSEATGNGSLRGAGALGQAPGSQNHRDLPRKVDHNNENEMRNEAFEEDQYEGMGAGMVKRVMREDVLYLVIVNMPTEVEMSRAWEELESAGYV